MGMILQQMLPWVLIVSAVGFVAFKLDVFHRPSQVAFPLLIVGFFLFFMWRQRISVRKKGATLFAPMTLTVSDAGVTSEAEGRKSETSWSQVKGYVRSERHIFIMLDGLTGHIIPIRCLSGNEQLQEFLSELQAHTSQLPPQSCWPAVARAVVIWLVLLIILGVAWNLGGSE